MTLTRSQLADLARRDLAALESPEGWLMAGLPRFARLFGRDACIAADAKRVIAAVTRCVNPDAPAEFHRFDTDELTDTSGALDSDAASAKIAQRRECTVPRHG